VVASHLVVAQRIGPRIVDLTVESPALGRAAPVRLLLPPGFADKNRRWPVLYLLHGCCDTYDSWIRSTDVEALTAEAPAIVVMPEGGRAGFYSNWWNAGRYGPPEWETFHLDEVRQILERDYRASERRVIAGLSMGGFGAMSYAARRPGMFAAAASYSGPLHTAYVSPSGFGGFGGYDGVAGVLIREGEDPLALWGPFAEQPAIWAEHNPFDLVDRLTGVRLYVSSGDGSPGRFDPPGSDVDHGEGLLCRESQAFAERAAALGHDVITDFYGSGTHTWPYWQESLHRSFPMLMAALGG
jgi:S-formylglutathione hydrolase FrmB